MNNIQILFSGGGGGNGSIQAGIAHFIFTHYNLQNYKDKIHVGGVSVGACTSLMLLASLHGIKTPKLWFEEFYLKILNLDSKTKLGYISPKLDEYFGCAFSISDKIKNSAAEYWTVCHENIQDYKNILCQQFHCTTTELSCLNIKNVVHNSFEESKDLEFAIKATTLLPCLDILPFI